MHQNPAAATFKGSSRASDPQPFPTVSPERGAVLRFSRSVLCELGQVAWGGARDHKHVLKLVTAGDFRLVSKLFAEVGGRTEFLVTAIHTHPSRLIAGPCRLSQLLPLGRNQR